MNFEFYCATDTGRVRSNNEDSVVVDAQAGVAVLADGMGGYNAGEVASGMATSFISSQLGRWLAEASAEATDSDVRRAMDICVDNANRAIFEQANTNPQCAGMGTTLVVGVFREGRCLIGHVGDSRAYRLRGLAEASAEATDSDVRRAMDICVDNANRAIFEQANTNPQCAGMGTTLVVGVFREGRCLIGHVGDSRAYRLRGPSLTQITHDHSLLQEQIDAGLITEEQAAFSANKNLVTRAVGVEDAVLLETKLHEIQSGDLYLFCSDGLSDMLPDEVILELLQTDASLEVMGTTLIAAANEVGGRDNISVILVRVTGEGGSSSGRSWWPFRRG